MSSENKHIKYSAWDIEKYLAGKLSQLEMHAMEKAALDDPFLAEAMEGYEGMKDTEWNNQLVSLREAIANKGVAAKVIPLHKSRNRWWKAVAAIFVVGSATALGLYLSNNRSEEKNNPQIAQAPAIPVHLDSSGLLKPEKPVPVSGTVSLNPTASATIEDIKETTDQLAKAQPEKKEDDKLIPDPNAPQVKAVESVAATGTGNSEKEKDVVTAPPVATGPPATNNNAKADDDSYKNNTGQKLNELESFNQQKNKSNVASKKDAQLNNFFTAQVVAPDNTPLPFTNISIKKENFGTYADSKGMVRLVSTDSVLNIEVRSVGYLPKTFSLRNNQSQTKIVLQEDEIAKKDTRVIGNANATASRSRRATLVTDSAVNVEPADGWENYNTYVANNLDISEETLRKDIRGEVELSFDVKSNGTISNIRVNKSMGAEYDEAAKRLILEGPQWKVKKGRKTSAKVKVQF